MSNVLKMLSRGGAAETDPNFNQTVLLLHGDGTNGAQNNTFLDSSTNNFTITRNGNTTQGTFSPFSLAAGEWSNYFAGGTAENRLSTTGVSIGTGNFTVECWIYLQSNTADQIIYDTGTNGFAINIANSNQVGFFQRVTNTQVITPSSSTAISYNTWTHIAVVRSGTGTNQTVLYINGTNVGTGTSAQNFTSTTVSIGARFAIDSTTWRGVGGYLSNVRSVVGSALYTTTFTPSTVPLTTTSQGASSSEVEILTCQSNRFVDNSTNAFAITRNGDVRVTPFSPFAPTAAYSAGTNGGSGYFDGSGDYLQYASNVAFEFGTGNFTIEFWWYPQNLSATQPLIYHTNDSGVVGTGEFVIVYSTSLGLRFYINSGATTIDQGSTSGWSTNQWYHITAVRNGNTLTLYRNGVSIASGSVTGVTIGASVVTQVGGETYDPLYSTGYISSYRVVKGTAVYTAAFTPPTAPVTAISGTSLLCNFTNAGIIDNTGKNVLETVGNAQIDTTTKKYGTGSLEFDGNGDRLSTPNSPDLTLGSGSFTIEFWMYANNTSAGYRSLVSDERYGPLASGWNIYQNGSNIEIYRSTGPGTSALVVQKTSAISATTWHHITWVRSGSSNYLFIDGVQQATATDSTNYTGLQVWVGDNNVTGTDYFFNGFIDDLRITKGVARYTANFTAPTKEFPDQ